MATRRRVSFERERSLELLTLEWQPRDKMITAIAAFIPPGKALRTSMQTSAYNDRYTAERRAKSGVEGPSRSPQWNDSQRVASGSRTLAIRMLHNLEKDKLVESAVIDGVKVVRLKSRPDK